MKNLIIVIHILLTLLLVGCADKGVYVGEKKDGKRHGQGTLTKPNGDKYVGEFKDGKQDGQGTYTHSDGKKYVGEWKDGYKTGQGTFSTTFGFNFKYNIHSSLRNDWVNEFNLVMNNLDKVIPVKPTNYFCSLDIYLWNSSADKPFKNKIGNATGMRFSMSEYGIFIVLEIPPDEFKYNRQFSYSNFRTISVIPHEYFHAFQWSLSKNFYDGKFKIKWLTEGAAASFESLYTQQYYNINHFKSAQNHVNIAVVNNPKIFESYDESIEEDRNYSSSVFMVLALVKELKKLDITEEKAFKLIFNDFWRKNPSKDNWKKVFQEVFNITLENFYLSLKNYTNDINSVLPSESLKLENIFPPPPPPPPKSDTSSPVVKGSGYTSSNASATSNVFVLKEVTSEFSVGDIVTFGDSKKEHEIWDAKVLKKIAMPDNTWVVLYHGSKFKISPGSGNIQGIVIKGAVGFEISPGMKVSVVGGGSPPPPPSDTSSPVVKVTGWTSHSAPATSNVFVLKEVTTNIYWDCIDRESKVRAWKEVEAACTGITEEFSKGDIVTFDHSKEGYEIIEAKVLKKSESGKIQDGYIYMEKEWAIRVLYKGTEFKITQRPFSLILSGAGNIQGIVLK